MKYKLKFLLPILALLFCHLSGKAQTIAIKTNLLYDVTATLNAGMEFGLAPRLTIDLSGNYNGLKMSHSRRWKHWIIQPEARYWLCERFAGHFFGIHFHGGQYNISNLKLGISFLGTDFSKLKGDRYQGWLAGLGLGYGYSWILGKHWNFETEIGVGYSFTRYDRYPCAECAEKIEANKTHNYFGITKLALNLIYLF